MRRSSTPFFITNSFNLIQHIRYEAFHGVIRWRKNNLTQFPDQLKLRLFQLFLQPCLRSFSEYPTKIALTLQRKIPWRLTSSISHMKGERKKILYSGIILKYFFQVIAIATISAAIMALSSSNVPKDWCLTREIISADAQGRCSVEFQEISWNNKFSNFLCKSENFFYLFKSKTCWTRLTLCECVFLSHLYLLACAIESESDLTKRASSHEKDSELLSLKLNKKNETHYYSTFYHRWDAN